MRGIVFFFILYRFLVELIFTHVKVEYREPVHISLPFCPFRVQRKPYTNEGGKHMCFAIYYNMYNKFNSELYPPKRAAKAVLKVVQLFLLVFYFCFSNRILDFQFIGGNSPFLDFEKYFIPRSEQRKQYQRCSN